MNADFQSASVVQDGNKALPFGEPNSLWPTWFFICVYPCPSVVKNFLAESFRPRVRVRGKKASNLSGTAAVFVETL
jgi:hypothetical protein